MFSAAKTFARVDGVGALRNRKTADGGFGSWLCENSSPSHSGARLIQAAPRSRTKESLGAQVGFYCCWLTRVCSVFTQPGSGATKLIASIMSPLIPQERRQSGHSRIVGQGHERTHYCNKNVRAAFRLLAKLM